MKKNSEQCFLILLGTGTPNAEPDRSGPSLAVVVDGKSYLVDCGPGLVRRAQAAFNQGITCLHPKFLNKLFITHLHSDHTAGYADLILTPWVLHRDKQLEVFGPEGTAQMTDNIIKAYQQDIQERLNRPEPIDEMGYQVKVCEIGEGIIYRNESVTVEVLLVDHGNLPAYAFKFITKQRIFVVSGDTTYCENLAEFARGCDVLVHEVYSARGLKSRESSWIKYHRSYHTSTEQLAEIARKVKPGKLVLYHCLYHGIKPDDLLKEITENYSGEVIIGDDLNKF
ncbi:MAG: hypothetical protein APR63_08630 [Desulfuromonas sp. SDB]|nr:MAG: hypothetical protein APR63_08630 [Desulfuromonas sp. SDB]